MIIKENKYFMHFVSSLDFENLAFEKCGAIFTVIKIIQISRVFNENFVPEKSSGRFSLRVSRLPTFATTPRGAQL